MHIKQLLLFSYIFIIISCGKNDSDDQHGHHVHVAPNGGQLLEVGEHGSGYNLELLLHHDGFLQIYVLDAHAENYVRIVSDSINFEILLENNQTKQFKCEAIEDPSTGEMVGNTSLFTSTERVTEYLPFKAIIPKLDILEFTFENLSFELVQPPKSQPE